MAEKSVIPETKSVKNLDGAAEKHGYKSADPKSYLAMMLLAGFAMPSGLARVYRGDEAGKVRFWIWVAAMVSLIIPLLNILAALVIIVLYVWGAVDFFILYNTKTDASGHALHTTMRDEKAAKVMFILVIVGLTLSGISLILGLILVSLGIASLQNIDGSNRSNLRFNDSHMRSESRSLYN